MSSMKFEITHHPEDTHAHKYRYAIVHGKNRTTSEGYPTHQHVTRAVKGMWKGIAQTFGVPTEEAGVIPHTRASLKGPVEE